MNNKLYTILYYNIILYILFYLKSNLQIMIKIMINFKNKIIYKSYGI